MIANQQTMWQVVTIAGPLLGGWLARVGGTKLPLAVTASSFALITATVALRVPETLAPKDRVPFVFSLGNSSPLGALRLFTNGPGLLCAVLMQTVDFWSDESSLWDVQVVHTVGITGWDTMARGFFESATSVLNLPSYAAAGWLTEKVGMMRALQLGTIANAVFYAAMGFAQKGWQLYAAYAWLTVSMFGSCTYAAQSAMAMVEANKAGIGQGELQAGMSSLNSISHMLAPMALSWLYDLGIRLGSPGLFYLMLAASHVGKLGMVTLYSMFGAAKSIQAEAEKLEE